MLDKDKIAATPLAMIIYCVFIWLSLLEKSHLYVCGSLEQVREDKVSYLVPILEGDLVCSLIFVDLIKALESPHEGEWIILKLSERS